MTWVKFLTLVANLTGESAFMLAMFPPDPETGKRTFTGGDDAQWVRTTPADMADLWADMLANAEAREAKRKPLHVTAQPPPPPNRP